MGANARYARAGRSKMKTSIASAPLAAFLLCSCFILCFAAAVIADEQQVLYFPQFADGAGYTTSWYFTGYGFGTSAIDVEVF
jgi:hypothetical protein